MARIPASPLGRALVGARVARALPEWLAGLFLGLALPLDRREAQRMPPHPQLGASVWDYKSSPVGRKGQDMSCDAASKVAFA